MEPIAVEAPVKVPTIPGPKPVPRPEPKAEAKPEPKAPTVPPLPTAVAKAAAGVSRRQLVIAAAAVCSLVAGIAVVRVMRPGKAELGDPPPTVIQPLAATAPTALPAPEAPPQNEAVVPVRPAPAPANTVTVSNTGSVALPSLPGVPTATIERNDPPPVNAVAVAPVTPPSVAPAVTPVTPPSVAPAVTPLVPPVTPPSVAPAVTPLVPPVNPPSVAPAVTPVVPPVTPPSVAPAVTPGTPPVTPPASNDQFRTAKIDPPSVAPVVVPPIVAAPAVPPVNVAPAGGMVVPPIGPNVVATSGQQPPVGPLPAPEVPPLPGVTPVSPSGPAIPPLPGATPATPPLPEVAPVTPKLPEVAPVTPKLPDVTPVSPLPTTPPVNPAAAPSVVPAVPPVAVPPVGVNPNPSALPPAVVPVPTPVPTTPKLEYVKPAGNPVVQPAASERPASTTFDVDLYEPRAGDTYDSISREFYNDVRYAAALRAFNSNRTLQNGVQVEVPPMHVLRKRFPQLVGANPVPSGVPAARPVGGAPVNGEWSPAGADPGFRASATTTFVVPPGGLTVRQIAKQTLGTEQRWNEIWQLNQQITSPSDVVPAGTEVRLPGGAKQP